MHEKRKFGRRGLIRIISFATAIVTVLAIATAIGFFTARRYRTMIEHTYQRALGDLTEYINSIDVSLEKGKYATTTKQVEGLSSKLWKEADLAKDALSLLPVESEEVGSTSKFLSQVGNFSVSLSRKVAGGEKISNEETETLAQLARLAKATTQSLETMANKVDNGSLKLGEVQKGLEDDYENEQPIDTDVDSGFKDMEDSFADYPVLIYDGPFSDHIMQQEPKFLKGKAEIDVVAALAKAKKFTGRENLVANGETAGNLPCYVFTDETMSVNVSKAGGELVSVLDSRDASEPKLSYEEAIKVAEKKMKELGHANFAMRYYEFNHGVLTINFALKQEEIVCYPDLIKIGISLDNEEVTFLDAKGYLSNYEKRTVPEIKISTEDAENILSSKLTVKSHSLVFIPADNLSETLCYEFVCVGDEDEQVLVYINTETGMEEQIMILIIDESGVLAI